MQCNIAKEAISAQLDHEDPVVPLETLNEHLLGCAGCTEWASVALQSLKSYRLTEAEQVPDLTAAILHAAGERAIPKPVPTDGLRPARWILGLFAVAQLLAAAPILFGSSSGPVHLDHELGSWDLALAFGLLFAAIKPERAWGMLPLVAAVSATLAATAVIDVASGHTTLSGESTHSMEIVGVFLLWFIAKTYRAHNAGSERSQIFQSAA